MERRDGSAYRSSTRSARRGRRLQVDPGRGDAHQHVGAGTGAQLAGPGSARPSVALGSRPRSRRGSRGGPRCRRPRAFTASTRSASRGEGTAWSVPYIASNDARRRTAAFGRGTRPIRAEPIRDVEQVSAVAIAADEVLRLDLRAVRRRPAERVRSIASGTPRHTTARSIPARRRIWASGRCDRTCRGGSRRASPAPSSSARAQPSSRLRTIVSPDTRNSSIRICHGPIASRPSAISRRMSGSASGGPRDSRRRSPPARRA